MDDKTISFSVNKDNEDVKKILKLVYDALVEKGYNPYDQIVGYLLSGDPSYIPRYNDARNLIKLKDRDQIIEELLKNLIENE